MLCVVHFSDHFRILCTFLLILIDLKQGCDPFLSINQSIFFFILTVGYKKKNKNPTRYRKIQSVSNCRLKPLLIHVGQLANLLLPFR